MPGEGTCEEMFSIFRKHCAEPVLDNLGCRIKSTIVPSHVLNKLDDEFYNLLNMYMVFLTRAPLTLVQLCRMVLSRQGSQELISLFKDIKSSSLRVQLFHITQDTEQPVKNEYIFEIVKNKPYNQDFCVYMLFRMLASGFRFVIEMRL